MMTLRSNTGFPSGGIIYEDPRTPTAKWLDDHTAVDDRAREIIVFRLANPSIYPEPAWTDFNFVRQQVVDYNCQRLGNDPNYCLEVKPKGGSAPATVAARLCPDCNIEIVPDFCPTCSGKRITGYHCPTCKKEFPK
jgi:hypothetical protein